MRLYNPSAKNIRATVVTRKQLKQVNLLDLEENKISALKPDGNKVRLSIAHHKIVTLLLK